jgi:hypothetical protein
MFAAGRARINSTTRKLVNKQDPKTAGLQAKAVKQLFILEVCRAPPPYWTLVQLPAIRRFKQPAFFESSALLQQRQPIES